MEKESKKIGKDVVSMCIHPVFLIFQEKLDHGNFETTDTSNHFDRIARKCCQINEAVNTFLDK